MNSQSPRVPRVRPLCLKGRKLDTVVNLYLSVANCEVLPRKKCISCHLSIGLTNDSKSLHFHVCVTRRARQLPIARAQNLIVIVTPVGNLDAPLSRCLIHHQQSFFH